METDVAATLRLLHLRGSRTERTSSSDARACLWLPSPPPQGSAIGAPWSTIGAVRSVCEAAGGEEGLLRLARAWHARVMADEVVSHAFSHGFRPDHSERLAAYWVEALGGPETFSAAYGDETSVVRMHSGNGPP